MAILDTIGAPVSAILNTITSQAWQPLVTACKNGTLAQLQNIRIGRLVLFEGGESKASNVFGSDKEGVPVAYLDVHDDKFWVRLALFADMVRKFSLARTPCAQQRNQSLHCIGVCRELYAGRGQLP